MYLHKFHPRLQLCIWAGFSGGVAYIGNIFSKGMIFFLGFKTGVNFFRLGKRISDLDDDTLHITTINNIQ